SLYPLLTLHMPRMRTPFYRMNVSEEDAIKYGTEFFQSLGLDTPIAFETIHDPGRNSSHAALGYAPGHFTDIIAERDYGICIDTGHSKMATVPLSEFLKLPYEISSIHLNGNDGTGDQHLLPTKNNVGDYTAVVEAIRRCTGPVVFEVRKVDELTGKEYTKEQVRECVEFWRNI
ncbi:sugar phosphate isomerase/epimerase, partial [Candidatus Woesearchaeota archaeon]|nr:sugar phosphate isomerase/epimerase [Candidatus Woesearchaeota archaeon]